MPHRVQIQRRAGWVLPPNTVWVARPSRYGNIFRIGAPNPTPNGPSGPMSRAIAVALYRDWLTTMTPANLGEWLEPLRGHDLACYCALDQECHADVLLELANR